MSNLDSLIAILPILIVMATGIVVLVCDACIPLWRQLHVVSGNVTLIGIVIAGYFSVSRLLAGADHTSAFNGAITTDNFAQACNLILLISAALATLMALTYLENKRLNHGEYYALVLFATSGAMLMAAAADLIVLFIAIETLSVALYVLAGFARTDQRSEEAALKYFLLGAFAAGFLLYGIALIYGGSGINQPGYGGTTNLETIGKILNVVHPSIMFMAGVALLLVGLAFKAALVPFHMWTPDVYEGAPTSVTAFMAATAKVGAFAAILRVFNAMAPISEYWLTAVQVLAVLTMFIGNLLAVTQDNVKRMLAYSSIAHAGYLMVAVAAVASHKAHDLAFGAAVFYLLAYTLMTMGAFAVLIYLSRRGKDYQTLDDLKGLAKTDPTSAYLMLVFMLSLGGIPPTMGFIGKWYIFSAAITAGQYGLALALAFASMISIYYYLKVVWMMCFQEATVEGPQEHAAAPTGVQLSLAVTVAASLLFGVIPGLVQPLMVAVQSILRP